MKISRLEGAALLLTAMAVAFTAGWMLRGMGDAPPIRVETQAILTQEEQTLAQPTAEPSAAPTSSPSPTAEPEDAESGNAESSGKVQPGEKIDLNTATAEELQRLPGIGPARAQAIVADREANGPFRIPEDLTRVDGIGEGILQGLIDYVTVE